MPAVQASTANRFGALTGDTEAAIAQTERLKLFRRIRNLRKKLQQIENLQFLSRALNDEEKAKVVMLAINTRKRVSM